ncbi:MAG: hypothetical protein HYZ37_16645 [Candidatus Solibacter usitatus]|nr:hypothetical protein [Candidatus Solibacter usitatus]
MQPLVLIPEDVVSGSGASPDVPLYAAGGKLLQLTLQITRVTERHTLAISIWGSSDGRDWGRRPLCVLPHRYYCGTYHHHLDLSDSPGVQYLRVEYALRCWEHAGASAYSTISLTAEVVHQDVLEAAAV